MKSFADWTDEVAGVSQESWNDLDPTKFPDHLLYHCDENMQLVYESAEELTRRFGPHRTIAAIDRQRELKKEHDSLIERLRSSV